MKTNLTSKLLSIIATLVAVVGVLANVSLILIKRHFKDLKKSKRLKKSKKGNNRRTSKARG